MKKLLERLKLIHKVNLVFYISILLVVSLIAIFISTTCFVVGGLEKNYDELKQVKKYTNSINKNLKALDYLTIENSLNESKEYEVDSKIAYENIIYSLNSLKEHKFFNENKNTVLIIKKIEKRLIGYKDITDSFQDEVKDSFEDGMYAVLALTTTSNIVFNELDTLSDEIESISKVKTKKLIKLIDTRRLSVIILVFIIFFFMFYINRKVVKSIIVQLNLLENGMNSFFEFLSKKRKDVLHLSYPSDDEISRIGKIIDGHMYIAEDLLSQERKDKVIVEQKVKDATKKIRALNDELEDTQREIIFTMGAIAEERSKETGNHVRRVAEYSYMLARFYGMSIKESLLLKNASPMHDIGKIGIPDHVLNKPGRFTDKEFEIMKAHSEIGYGMLKHSERSIFKVASIVAYEHHERYDGQGYPRGLKGENIHIYGRITAIADVFDALGSDRIYKRAWPLEKILKLFKEERGKHFDPLLIDLFLNNLDDFIETKERIDNIDDSISLSKYIEDFEKVE
ncbi:MAG: HD domain-containing protein [Campylobacterota bacterium]|nr:HD domain-containing protein [Campylobacterota bacterium]